MRATARWPGWPANTARRWCCWRITGAIRPRPCCCACCAAPGWRAWPPWRRCRAVTRWTTCGPGWTRTAMTSCEPAPPSRRPPAGARCRTRPIPIPITPARRCASCWRRRWTRAGPAGAASWRGMRAHGRGRVDPGRSGARGFRRAGAGPGRRQLSLRAWRDLSPARQAQVLRWWLDANGARMPSEARMRDLLRAAAARPALVVTASCASSRPAMRSAATVAGSGWSVAESRSGLAGTPLSPGRAGRCCG